MYRFNFWTHCYSPTWVLNCFSIICGFLGAQLNWINVILHVHGAMWSHANILVGAYNSSHEQSFQDFGGEKVHSVGSSTRSIKISSSNFKLWFVTFVGAKFSSGFNFFRYKSSGMTLFIVFVACSNGNFIKPMNCSSKMASFIIVIFFVARL